ncbi:hypothetical protein FisN_5Hh132 [Fistulifera solaris]|uniref:Uncharacterized protein n=1 Tax=Fistulifera solaris TaxID=1519565 RepID=A0A1Z5JTY6_FISSO|nr:hypothetical protein FisN_5Hh132 [Fistulifera solaris]|eukprot:GAX17480.1 hypothetical protein FisN_5Hh132 [Fistulifera solaris]
MARSLCGSFLTSKRSLVAFTWTITTVLNFVAFVAALVMMVQIHAHYIRLEHYYEQQYEEYQRQYANNNNNEGEGQAQGQEDGSLDRKIQEYIALTQLYSPSMTFVAVYSVILGFALNLYGSTAIVGFTSLRGDYIGPCFSSPSPAVSRMKTGIFGGAVVVFANILLVCAVVLGEVTVEDGKDDHDREDREPYEVERIATVLAITCMFLSGLYMMFAILLYLYHGKEADDDEAIMEHHHHHDVKPLRSITNDSRREKFITMEET